jgi:hypothetical protein
MTQSVEPVLQLWTHSALGYATVSSTLPVAVARPISNTVLLPAVPKTRQRHRELQTRQQQATTVAPMKVPGTVCSTAKSTPPCCTSAGNVPAALQTKLLSQWAAVTDMLLHSQAAPATPDPGGAQLILCNLSNSLMQQGLPDYYAHPCQQPVCGRAPSPCNQRPRMAQEAWQLICCNLRLFLAPALYKHNPSTHACMWRGEGGCMHPACLPSTMPLSTQPDQPSPPLLPCQHSPAAPHPSRQLPHAPLGAAMMGRKLQMAAAAVCHAGDSFHAAPTWPLLHLLGSKPLQGCRGAARPVLGCCARRLEAASASGICQGRAHLPGMHHDVGSLLQAPHSSAGLCNTAGCHQTLQTGRRCLPSHA